MSIKAQFTNRLWELRDEIAILKKEIKALTVAEDQEYKIELLDELQVLCQEHDNVERSVRALNRV